MIITKKEVYPTMRSAWTMIELIFVIVIIAILAVIALPKLSATRDDAKLVADVSKMSRCLTYAGSTYMATAVRISVGDSQSCDSVECYTWAWTNTGDFEIAIKPNTPTFCTGVNEIGSHLVGTHVLAGTTVSR